MDNVSVRLQKEVGKLLNKPPPGITFYLTNESLLHFRASIIGIHGSPYENGIFDLKVETSVKYPFSPPRVQFITKIYHPNIDEAGRICLDILKAQPEGSWRPTYTIESVLIAIQLLMAQPNPENPLVLTTAQEYKFNRSEFDKKAKEWTIKYAGSCQAANPRIEGI